jgi:hypothetical protein
MFKKILRANDSSVHACNALSLALQIAKHGEAELPLASVWEQGPVPVLALETAQSRLRPCAWPSAVKFRIYAFAGHPAPTSSILRTISTSI